MKKRLLVMALLCLWFVGAQAQEEDKLSRLMSEREQLVLEYQYYKQQNSSFWGTQSKKDLINVIETLRKIINKDSELIGAVKEHSIRQIATSTVENNRASKLTIVDQRNFENQISSLKGEVKVLQTTLKKRERAIKDLESQLQSTYEIKYGKDKVISILGVTCFILLLYAVFLQVRLSSTKAKVRKKKKV